MDLDQKAVELGDHFKTFLRGFQSVRCSAAAGLLNHQEIRVVEFLGREGSQIMRAIAEHLRLAVNSVTTVVDGLEQKKLVVRNRSTEDRRVIQVELTSTGRKLHDEIDEARLELYRSLLKHLSAREQNQFLELFRKIAQGSEEATSAPSG